MVSSKLNHLVYFFVFLPFMLEGVVIYYAHDKSTSVLGPSILLALMLTGILYFIQGLTIESDRLRIFQKFRRRSLPRSEIRSIRLWDPAGRITDGISIETTAGETINLGGSKSFDQGGIWRNEFELKQALAEGYAELVDPPAGLAERTAELVDRTVEASFRELAEPETFRGNALLSLNGLCALGFGILLVWGNIKLASPGSLSPWWGFLLASLAPVVMITLMTYRLFYFVIAGDTIQIRNHIVWWYKKEYPIVDINSVVIERARARESRKLCLYTNDLRTHRYSAGSLRTEDWHALATALKQHHITAKSEF